MNKGGRDPAETQVQSGPEEQDVFTMAHQKRKRDFSGNTLISYRKITG